MPTGVAILKMKRSHFTSLKSSGKVLTRDTPREKPAALLWTPIASTILRTLISFIYRPHASPSKRLWTERAIIRTKGVKLHPGFFFLLVGEFLSCEASSVLFTSWTLTSFTKRCC